MRLSLSGGDWLMKDFVGEDWAVARCTRARHARSMLVAPGPSSGQRARNWHNTGWAYFDDNYFHLLPGEEVTISIEWDQVNEAVQGIEVSAMNAGSKLVDWKDNES